MVRELDSRRQQAERVPDGFEKIEDWRITGKVAGLLRESTSPQHSEISWMVIDGFEDILNGEPLGDGTYDNHTGSAQQLIFSLGMSPNPEIAEIARDVDLLHSSEVVKSKTVKRLREKQVLKGVKIIDLGCGSGSFAVAVKSLGAEVYTADALDLRKDRKDFIDGHVIINFGDSDVEERLKSETGGNFDLVTENIIGHGSNDRIRLVSPEQFQPTILRIARTLLKEGGYLFGSDTGSQPFPVMYGPFRKL